MKEYSTVLILYNPNAMRGRIDEFLPIIKKRLLTRFSKVDLIASPNEIGVEDLAYKNAEQYDIIVACGGDGTVHQTINGVMKSGFRPLIGILPYGTCNDVASTLGIPCDLNKAIDCILRLNTTKYDLMYDGTDYITYALATGYITDASYSAGKKIKKKLGRFAYVLAGIKSFFKIPALPMTIEYDNERIHSKFAYFMLMNGYRVGGFKINKNELLDNGTVKLVMIKKTNGLATLFRFIKLFLKGIKAFKDNKFVIIKDVDKVKIENHSNTPFTLDGEKISFLKKTIRVNSSIELIKK